MAEKKVKKVKTETVKKRAPRVKKRVEAAEVQKTAESAVVEPSYVKKEPKPRLLPEKNVFEATGRRKTAAAHVYLYKGSGKILVNSKPYEEYFYKRPILLSIILSPLKEVKMLSDFDIQARVFGGGIPSQADALRLGIAKALVAFNQDLRKPLRSVDLLKRDPRVKERKKYGLKRARRAFQYTKR